MSTLGDEFRAPLPEELAPLFPNYQIVSLIAKGGMGAVYHAIQTSLEREIAIKILPLEFGDDPEFCKSFETEAKAMARLNHPNLIGVYDFGEVNGMLFIAMEYVPGRSLWEACNGSALDPAEVIRLMAGISQGLAHAHDHGILHRDIKPANILLDAQGQPKIGDFGLASHLESQIHPGESIFGTPGYTAPEVVERPLTVDQRADIFSLGVLLHELLTGRLPASDPRPPSVISHCDPRFDAVVAKATSLSPILRYQHAVELAAALQKITTTSRPSVRRTAAPARSAAPRPPAPRRFSKLAAKKSGGGGVVVGLMLVVVALLVFLYWERISPKANPSPPPIRIVVQAPEPAISTPEIFNPQRSGPDSASVVFASDPLKSDPGPAALAESVELPPGPEGTGSVNTGQTNFDVDGFLAHARSVMVTRCVSNSIDPVEARKKNVAAFKTEALKLLKENLPEKIHFNAENELNRQVSELEQNSYWLGDTLKAPMRNKKYLIPLHQEYLQKEKQIHKQALLGYAEPQKTYLYGLGLKVKALQEAHDPAAATVIQAEMDKVAASESYFPGLMQAAKRD